ncbi:hypothetical protein L6452_26181 [Arctium lappa]|uniref:Uncharacterized protein n=1 Tax=Arctium lappa TaxID=4217 RepID=A0ACB9AC87_ARCLA|nr:hypothetical protein L6452_26181 [Arctium lappa]
MIQDENAILDDPSDRASHDTPMPSHPSVGADLSTSRRTPNDVFPTIMYMPYKPNNYHVDFDRIKIHQVIRAILKGHPLAPALSYCADVPEVYLQQAWHTITKNEIARPHRFELQVDQFESFLSYKQLRLILELPEPNSRPGRNTYDSFPSEEEVYEGIRNLGYVGTLNKPADFDKSNLPPVWYALFSVLIRCLTSKHSGTDSASLLYLRLFLAVVYDRHVDYTFIFWTELSEVVHDKFTNKKRKFIPFVRFMKLIVRSMLRSNPAIPHRLSWPQVPDSEMSYIQKQKKTFNYSMTIPYALIANYTDVANEDAIEYCMENEFVEAVQDEPSHDNQAVGQDVEVEAAVSEKEPEVEKEVEDEQEVAVIVEIEVVQEDVASQQIDNVIVDIGTEATDAIAFDFEDEDDTAADDILASDKDEDESDSDDDDSDHADQPRIQMNLFLLILQVDELDTTFDQASAPIQSQAPASSLAAIQSSDQTLAVALSSDQARASTDKFSTLNDVIRQLSKRMDAEKEAQILKLKTFFKGKMPEIDTSVIPPEIPFRRPTGVVLREPSSAMPTSTSPVVSLPFPSMVSLSVGISTSAPSKSSLHDLSISELTDLLYARLLSMSSPEHQDQDLISLLRNFQPTPPPVPSSESDRITALFDEFHAFRLEVRSIFADLKLFMSQAFSDLSSRLDSHDQCCRTEVGPSLKRRHDQDDSDHQGHEGEMARRPRVEGSSKDREDIQEEAATDEGKSGESVEDCKIQNLVNVMIENVDLSSLHNELNISESNINDNMQIVVYMDPDVSASIHEVEESEAANDMRSFFGNFIEINSDDDEDVRLEKICQVNEEDCDDIVIISDTEDDTVFMDAKDEEEVDLLYRDLPTRDEIPESVNVTSTPVASSAPTTTIPSRSFEVGQSSRAEADVPPSDPVIPPSILEEGPALSRRQRQRNLQRRYLASRQRSTFLKDTQRNIFVSRRRPINIYAILGVEKESDAYQYTYLMFIKNLYHRTQDISQALFVIKRFIRRQIRFFRVFDFQMAVESFQPVVNLLRPNRSLSNLESYPFFTIVEDPYGVVYKNGSNEKCFLRFEEITHFSDGTLKVIKLQLEQRLKDAKRRFVETRANAFHVDNEEI